jgi:hypothetical protein
VCDAGSCRACSAHSECASGVCTATGACANATDIAYVAPGASDTADCSQGTKCSLTHGVSLGRRYVLLSTGTFTLSGTLNLSGTISLIGGSTVKPEITLSTTGSIISVAPATELTLDNLRLRGANGINSNVGSGLFCINNPSGTRRVHLVDFESTQNQYNGVYLQQCTLTALRSSFVNNGFDGVAMTDSDGTFDQCLASGNSYDGFRFDQGLYTLHNNFSFRNGAVGIELSADAGSQAEFNTVVDNAGGGLLCAQTANSAPNNIAVRNGANNASGCTFPSSIISANVTGLNFKSPDAMPYDYHLTAGSLAIDMALVSGVAVDYDGDARPQGAGRDVGADEFKP